MAKMDSKKRLEQAPSIERMFGDKLGQGRFGVKARGKKISGSPSSRVRKAQGNSDLYSKMHKAAGRAPRSR